MKTKRKLTFESIFDYHFYETPGSLHGGISYLHSYIVDRYCVCKLKEVSINIVSLIKSDNILEEQYASSISE